MEIRNILNFDHPYYTINREERNLAAIFYYVLLQKDNLKTFLSKIDIDFPIIEEEMAIYFEYAFLRDLWFSIDKNDNEIKRHIILSLLKPNNKAYLGKCTIQEFNIFFGAVPTPSRDFIQSPGNWSIDNYKDNLPDKDEFMNVCKFKWCFNAKPDIVIHTSNDYAICIEGKFESAEGLYPSKESEKKEFNKRGLAYVKQTEIQMKIMDLLGIKSSFVFIVQKEISSASHKTLLWEDAFKDLDLTGSPVFIRDWIKRLSKPKSNMSIVNPLIKNRIEKTYFPNKIAPGYIENILRLKNYFPTAYNFMKYPELNDTYIWLSTSVNAHLYFSNYFLAYIKISDNELIFSPNFNNIIPEYTKNMSGLLFSGAIQGLIKLYDGFNNGWAQQKGETIIIKKPAPEKFFNKLISYIESL